MKAIYKYDGPLGTYALEEQNGLLTRLWLGDRMALLPGETEISETPLLKEAHRHVDGFQQTAAFGTAQIFHARTDQLVGFDFHDLPPFKRPVIFSALRPIT